jgi:hypothetical protein
MSRIVPVWNAGRVTANDASFVEFAVQPRNECSRGGKVILASEGVSIVPIDALELSSMASGHVCLNLSERVGWDAFPAYARIVVRRLGATSRIVAESVEIRIWELSFAGEKVSLVWNDYPFMVSLESDSDSADIALNRLYLELKAAKA